MKKIFTIICVAAVALTAFSACTKDNQYENDLIIEKEQFELQKPILKEFAMKNFENPKLDTASGIWYDLIEAGVDSSYTYSIEDYGSSYTIKAPYVKVEYTGRLLSGTQFDATKEGETATFKLLERIIPAWNIAFLPQKISGKAIGGLTVRGLKKNSKIRIVTPSFYGYGKQSSDKIPAHSPLDFTISVKDISDKPFTTTQ